MSPVYARFQKWLSNCRLDRFRQLEAELAAYHIYGSGHYIVTCDEWPAITMYRELAYLRQKLGLPHEDNMLIKPIMLQQSDQQTASHTP